jgi:acylphosphatase
LTHRLHVFVSGRVQGVGFRYCTHREALARDLTGWVRNLPDGRVEAEFEGRHSNLESMLDWCRCGPRGAVVEVVESAWEQCEARYSHFAVRT